MGISELQAEMLRTVERFARERVAPQAAEIDRKAEFPRQLYREAAELGLFGLWIPPEFGGVGPDLIIPLLISECLARRSASFALVYSNCGDACTPIVHSASDALKQRFLPGIAAGELIPCFALSEPEAGSDAANISTTAERRKDIYVLRGRKSWCTNGAVGDVFTVFAKTDPTAGSKGVSAFVVPRDTPGLVIGKSENLVGLRQPDNPTILRQCRSACRTSPGQ
jgi:alkylation response protein AidB-like acyl-CoA dehydrogenase